MRSLTIIVLSLLAFGAAAFADTQPVAPGGAPAAQQQAAPPGAQQVTITNKLVGTAKTWLPGTIKITAGKPVQFTLVNTLADPHGFSAPGLTAAPVVVLPKETKTIVVMDPKPGQYKFICQLHPKHVGGTIDVVK